MKKVTVLSRKKIYERFFGVEECEVQFGDDVAPVLRSMVTTRNASGILVHNVETQKLIFIRQYRMGALDQHDPYVIEIPAGVLDKGEDAETCARREVLEETGYVLQTIEKIGTFYASPGYTNEQITLFYGTTGNHLRENNGGGLEAEHEYLELLEYSPDEAFMMIETGEICDSKTAVTLFWLKSKLSDKA